MYWRGCRDAAVKIQQYLLPDSAPDYSGFMKIF
jgi:hypothetical protein